jgi:hypothetical protein
MQRIEMSTGSLGAREQEEQIPVWQDKYTKLIDVLGELGTQVSIDRILETDIDIPPGHFVRHATHEFVFPPQEVKVVSDNSRVIDPNPDYELRHEQTQWQFDPTKVQGHLRVRYDDAGSRVHFELEDVLATASQVPDEVTQAIGSMTLPETNAA